MQKRVQTPLGHLKSIENRMGHFGRYKDDKRLEAYLLSDEFARSFLALEPAQRLRAVRAITQAEIKCASKYPPIPSSRQPRARPDWKNPATIAKLKAAWARHGSDKGIAREMQISLPAAKIARWKFIGTIKPRDPAPSVSVAAA